MTIQFKEHYHWSKIRMNQNETIVGHNESITVDAELFSQREREEHIIILSYYHDLRLLCRQLIHCVHHKSYNGY